MSNPYLDGVYNVGTVTLTAGSKDFTTKDANLRSDAPILAGDRIHVNGKELIIEAITDMDKGRLYYDCPSDCAGTDIPLVITLISSPARIQSNAAKLIEKLSKGYLPSLAELTAKEGQVFCATNVPGELAAVYLKADDIAETDNRKIMTAEERNRLANIISLDQNKWNTITDTTEALISPRKLSETIKNSFSGAPDSGWVKLPNGILMQWGLKQSDNSSYGQIWYPTAFTQKCFFYPVLLQAWTNEGFAPIVFGDWADNQNLSSHGFHCRQINGTSGVTSLNTWNVAWLAIGY